jgi:hypothetical protein
MNWLRLDWIGLDWFGLDWIGLDWFGLVRFDFGLNHSVRHTCSFCTMSKHCRIRQLIYEDILSMRLQAF